MEVTFCCDWHGTLSMECNNQTRVIKKTDKSYPALMKFVSRRMWKFTSEFSGYENEFNTFFTQCFSPENDNGGSSYLHYLITHDENVLT